MIHMVQLFQMRRDRLAGRTPFGPEVDDNGIGRSKHVLVESSVGCCLCGHVLLLMILILGERRNAD